MVHGLVSDGKVSATQRKQPNNSDRFFDMPRHVGADVADLFGVTWSTPVAVSLESTDTHLSRCHALSRCERTNPPATPRSLILLWLLSLPIKPVVSSVVVGSRLLLCFVLGFSLQNRHQIFCRGRSLLQCRVLLSIFVFVLLLSHFGRNRNLGWDQYGILCLILIWSHQKIVIHLG